MIAQVVAFAKLSLMPKILVEKGEHLHKGKIAQEILYVLQNGDVNLKAYHGSGITAAFLPKLEARGIGRKRKNNVRIALDRLRRQGFIDYSSVHDRNALSITAAGEKRLYRYKFENLSLPEVEHWDGIWRAVMFDIPEDRKVARDALSRKLKRMGCFQLQRSVFIHYLPCREELSFMEDYFGFKDLITYMEVKEISQKHDIQLRKHFRLK